MAKLSLLLDFDGVILRNHPIGNIVVKRCQSMVHKSMKHVDFESCKKVNKQLYESTGHTVLGLQRLGYKDISIPEFDQLVYEKIDYKMELAEIHKTHHQDIQSINNIYKWCEASGVDMWIFSNAPDSWCYSISHMMDIPVLPSTRSLVSSLKPNPECYLDVRKKVKSDKYVFVDDKMINLVNAPQDWTCVWMNDSKHNLSKNFSVIDDLIDLRPIIEKHLT